MGKKKSGKKGPDKKKNISSGLKLRRWANREIKRIDMKIARFKANAAAGKKHKLSAEHICKVDPKASCASRHNNWDTAGLERHRAYLQKIAARPPKYPS